MLAVRIAGSGKLFGHLFGVKSAERVDELGRGFGLVFAGHVSEHQGQLGDGLTDRLQRFETVGMCRLIAAYQAVFEGVRESVYRCNANRRGDTGEGVGGTIHLVLGGCVRVGLKRLQLALQRGKMSTCLGVEDFDQVWSEGKAAPCLGFLIGGGRLFAGRLWFAV